jgi:hypothetical protein
MPTSIYAPHHIGTVKLLSSDTLTAGSMATIELLYTAGKFGIDDQGAIRLMFRFASDSGRPQFDRPDAPNYVTAVASNNAILGIQYDPFGGVRSYWKEITVRVLKNYLKEGDTIKVVLGDRSLGSSGMRIQTMREPEFGIKVEANPFGTGEYGPVPGLSTINLVAGKPVTWKAVVPTLRGPSEAFSLKIRVEDDCGNPALLPQQPLYVKASRPVRGLPESLAVSQGQYCAQVDELSMREAGDFEFHVLDGAGNLLCTSNPMRVSEAAYGHYWADFHAQSEETVGTNPARDYFEFARDIAFLDIVGHQGNDFQISNEFWRELNELTTEFEQEHRFIAIPGYEYSPVTPLGGDRNILFRHEGRSIRRSSHSLVPDISDIDTDCNHASELFEALRKGGEDVVAFAHVGGRFADLAVAHDGEIERSVEIHSNWGTFEWLLHEAFDLGFRVGVVCNSDDHKGRPGASHPGASVFGAYGGLTCLELPALTRQAVFDCLRARHHYGTTGQRLYMKVTAEIQGDAWKSDVEGKPVTDLVPTRSARMGDIVRMANGSSVEMAVEISAGVPIERIEVRVGRKCIETIKPGGYQSESPRIRIQWEGAECRGRGRQSIWDGSAQLQGNSVVAVSQVNFWHLDKSARMIDDSTVYWESVTTGNLAGIDLLLTDPARGELKMKFPGQSIDLPIASVGADDKIWEAGGLHKRVRAFRLPARGGAKSVEFKRQVPLQVQGDSPVWICVTLEDGTQAWSSPIYFHY